MKTVWGIDPSLTGTAVVTWSERWVSPLTCVFRSASCGVGVQSRINRFARLADDVAGDRSFCQLNWIFIEGYSHGAKFTTAPLCEYGGILRLRLLEITPNIVEVAPSAVKKFATGKGKADKASVRAHVVQRWGVMHESDDEADAYVLCRIGRAYLGLDECANQAQREVIESLKNPKVKKRKVRA